MKQTATPSPDMITPKPTPLPLDEHQAAEPLAPKKRKGSTPTFWGSTPGNTDSFPDSTTKK